MKKISVISEPTVDATNAYTVTVSEEFGESQVFDVHTNAQGRGLWVDGKQVEGTSQFDVGRNPSAAIRRYFAR